MPTPMMVENQDWLIAHNNQITNQKDKIAVVPRNLESGWPLLQISMLAVNEKGFVPALGGGKCHAVSVPFYLLALLLSQIFRPTPKANINAEIYSFINENHGEYRVELKNTPFFISNESGAYGALTQLHLCTDQAGDDRLAEVLRNSDILPFGFYDDAKKSITKEQIIAQLETLNTGAFFYEGQVYIDLKGILEQAKLSEEDISFFAAIFNVEEFNQVKNMAPRAEVVKAADTPVNLDAEVVKAADTPINLDAEVVKAADAPVNLDAEVVKVADAPVNLDAEVVKAADAPVNLDNRATSRKHILADCRTDKEKFQTILKGLNIIIENSSEKDKNKLMQLIQGMNKLLILCETNNEPTDSSLYKIPAEYLLQVPGSKEKLETLITQSHPIYKSILNGIGVAALLLGCTGLIVGALTATILSGGTLAAALPAGWYVSGGLLAAAVPLLFFSRSSGAEKELHTIQESAEATRKDSTFPKHLELTLEIESLKLDLMGV